MPSSLLPAQPLQISMSSSELRQGAVELDRAREMGSSHDPLPELMTANTIA